MVFQTGKGTSWAIHMPLQSRPFPLVLVRRPLDSRIQHKSLAIKNVTSASVTSEKVWPRLISNSTWWPTLSAATLLAATLLCPLVAFNASARVSTSEAGDTLVGVPRIIDGDTLKIGDERVRLYGIDAPETKQFCNDKKGQPYACGEVATDALREKVGDSSLACRIRAKDLYQRNVSSCTLQGTGDIGHWLVQNGYAVAYQEYSKDYVKDEDAARKEHKGIWQGDFRIPAQWRRDKKGKNGPTQSQVAKGLAAPLAKLPEVLSKKQEASHAPGCDVKGNINAQGTHIYHVPGGRYYEAVKIEPSKGEKFFCTESDAQREGFRKSKE